MERERERDKKKKNLLVLVVKSRKLELQMVVLPFVQSAQVHGTLSSSSFLNVISIPTILEWFLSACFETYTRNKII